MLKFVRNHKFRISIGLILIVLLLSLLGQVGTKRQENWFSYLLQSITHPFFTLSDTVYDSVTGLWQGYIWLAGVAAENVQLRSDLAKAQEKIASHQEIITAYLRQRELLKFAQQNQDQKVFAEVIGEMQQGFSRLLVLNKGTKQGIKKNFAVVTPKGVVGKIQSVTAYQSVVQLITDRNSKFPVLLQSTRDKAMVQGSLDGTLTIIHFPRRSEIEKGGLIITSGLAGVLPKGFSVGRITSVEKKEFGLFQTARLEPAVDLNKLEEVAVILYSRQNIHQPLFTTQ